MFVPRWIVQAAFAVAAVAVGWLLQSAFAAETPTAAPSGERIVTVQSEPLSESDQVSPPAQAPATSTGQPIALTVRVEMPEEGKSKATTSVTSSSGQTVTYPAQSTSGRASLTTSSSKATLAKSKAKPRKTVTNKRTTTNTRTTNTSAIGTAAYGNNIVIASDGSIVVVGEGADLNANTGNAQQGGAIGVDTNDSELSTSVNGTSTGAGSEASLRARSASSRPAARSALTPTAATTSSGSATSTTKSSSASSTLIATRGATSSTSLTSLTSGAAGQAALATQSRVITAATRPVIVPVIASPFGLPGTVEISGYEDHSVLVYGDRNIATYDDSNVIVNRDGMINANTGDTDSSGLNAVDTVYSYVRSGDHCDDGCDDESIIGAQQGHFGDDDDDDDDSDSDDGDTPDPDEPDEPDEDDDEGLRRTSQKRTLTTTTSNPAAPYLKIGGDGYDNISLHVFGNDNIVTDDDSNIIVGGTGKVNAQIGDSDTGGTTAMSTYYSVVLGGTSR